MFYSDAYFMYLPTSNLDYIDFVHFFNVHLYALQSIYEQYYWQYQFRLHTLYINIIKS